MGRPSKEVVDLALLISRPDSDTASNAAKILALEVIALRGEVGERFVAAVQHEKGTATMAELFEAASKKLDRLALVPEELRKLINGAGSEGTQAALEWCARLVERALKGGA